MNARKQIHINLCGEQIADYQLVRQETGITNDSDLVRFLFRQEANRIRRAPVLETLVDSGVGYDVQSKGGNGDSR